jgi:molecular chaperone GrpE
MTGRSKKYENDTIDDAEINASEEIADENEPVEDNSVITDNSFQINELENRIEQLEQEAFDYRDKLMRKAAEFENYKKRTSEEFVRLIETANEDLIVSILPIMDDMERFRSNYNPDNKADDLKKVVDMIFDKLNSVLINFGLEEINSLNKEFDPNDHDALMTMEKEGVAPNIVVGQHEKGFKLKNKVIRHAKVIVSK